jgi:hypothetical protein
MWVVYYYRKNSGKAWRASFSTWDQAIKYALDLAAEQATWDS